MDDPDTIVVGLGVAGLAAARALATRDNTVLGIEQGPVVNPDATSHGLTRLFRLSYPDERYVPILQDALEDWRTLEDQHDTQIIHQSGHLDITHEDNPRHDKMVNSLEAHDIDHSILTPEEVNDHYPLFNIPPDYRIIHHSKGARIDAHRATSLLLKTAKQHGAAIHTNEQVTDWQTNPDDTITVTTDETTYTANTLVVTTGAWAVQQFPTLEHHLTVANHTYTHYLQAATQLSTPHPGFIIKRPPGKTSVYGFIEPHKNALKIGKSNHDKHLQHDPDTYTRGLNTSYAPETTTAEELFNTPTTEHVRDSCMITNTPDDDPIIDTVTHPNIIAGVGLSGHGFKWGNMVGKLLADLATDSTPTHDITPFSADRFD